MKQGQPRTPAGRQLCGERGAVPPHHSRRAGRSVVYDGDRGICHEFAERVFPHQTDLLHVVARQQPAQWTGCLHVQVLLRRDKHEPPARSKLAQRLLEEQQI